MSRGRSSVDDWRRAVFAAPSEHLSDATKVLLLYLADHMRESDLKVSVKREKIARDLGRSERRINDRFKDATDLSQAHRYLDRVVRGQKHVQAVYQGLMPYGSDALSAGPPPVLLSNSQGDGNQHPENYGNRHRENPAASVDLGSQQDPRGSCLSKPDPTCPWHEHDICPADCANYVAGAKRRTA